MKAHTLSALIMGVALLIPLQAHTAEFNRRITIIVPFAPGGTADVSARQVGERLSAEIGQPVIIENIAGANGQAAATALKVAPADGHTLLQVSHGMLGINPALYSKLSYSMGDFAPLTNGIKVTHLLIVPVSGPAKSVADLVAAAKERPGTFTYASAGIGSGGHLAAELLKLKAGIDATHVPYRGSSAVLPDLVAGRVNFTFDGPGAWMALVRGGQVRVLAVTDDKRMPQLPAVPTMAEAGYPGVELNAWFGYAAAAGTPKDMITKLHAAVAKAIKDPTFAEKVAAFGAAPASSDSPQEFERFIQSEAERLGALVKATGARMD